MTGRMVVSGSVGLIHRPSYAAIAARHWSQDDVSATVRACAGLSTSGSNNGARRLSELLDKRIGLVSVPKGRGPLNLYGIASETVVVALYALRRVNPTTNFGGKTNETETTQGTSRTEQGS
jgi:hypothetical protein